MKLSSIAMKATDRSKFPLTNKIAVSTLPSYQLPGATDTEIAKSSTTTTEPSTKPFGSLVRTQKVETLCQSFGLTQYRIRKLRRIFDRYDVLQRDMISTQDFLNLIREEQSPLSNGIFRFADQVSDQGYIGFDDFLQCIVRFATLTKPELIQFLFDMYDVDRSGSLNAQEFDTMSRELQSPQFSYPTNIEIAIGRMKKGDMRLPLKLEIDDTNKQETPSKEIMVDQSTFIRLARSFPVAFYPILNMQNNVRESTFGQQYWTNMGMRKMKVGELLKHLGQSGGELPRLTWWERVTGIFGTETQYIRQAAVSRYLQELHDAGEPA